MISDSIKAMLARYPQASVEDVENALKQVIQELALLGLYRAKFFQKAVFYGGSALRLFYGLNRFSEDLDFSLIKPDPKFEMKVFQNHLQNELLSHGFEVEFSENVKARKSSITSAFMKANTLVHIVQINAHLKNHRDSLIKIKLEVDRDPPG